jgi:hypothetical protein
MSEIKEVLNENNHPLLPYTPLMVKEREGKIILTRFNPCSN